MIGLADFETGARWCLLRAARHHRRAANGAFIDQ